MQNVFLWLSLQPNCSSKSLENYVFCFFLFGLSILILTKFRFEMCFRFTKACISHFQGISKGRSTDKENCSGEQLTNILKTYSGFSIQLTRVT